MLHAWSCLLFNNIYGLDGVKIAIWVSNLRITQNLFNMNSNPNEIYLG